MRETRTLNDRHEDEIADRRVRRVKAAADEEKAEAERPRGVQERVDLCLQEGAPRSSKDKRGTVASPILDKRAF
jgi:hypothetical protein